AATLAAGTENMLDAPSPTNSNEMFRKKLESKLQQNNIRDAHSQTPHPPLTHSVPVTPQMFHLPPQPWTLLFVSNYIRRC
ncbi:hypothetical protein ATANTOWER_019905, partial [Ataeniobius toweri]|nr:hypothetical protein [Ataeniobius toweri]